MVEKPSEARSCARNMTRTVRCQLDFTLVPPVLLAGDPGMCRGRRGRAPWYSIAERLSATRPPRGGKFAVCTPTPRSSPAAHCWPFLPDGDIRPWPQRLSAEPSQQVETSSGGRRVARSTGERGR